MTFHLMFVNIFSSVWVVEWPPFGKKLLIRLTIFDYLLDYLKLS